MYVPGRRSLARRVIEFFIANPGEALTRSDISEKFETDARGVAGCLSTAIASKVLKRAHDESLGMTVYMAGEQFDACAACMQAQAAGHAPKHHRQLPAIDLAAVRVSYDRPMPITNPRQGLKRYAQLLSRLDKPGASVAGLPIAYRSALQKAIHRHHAANPNVKLAIRTLNPDEIGIWRTA